MSKIKELRNSDENNIGIIKMLEQLLVSDKTKYVELLRKLILNRIDSDETKRGVYEDLYSRLPLGSFSDDMSMFELMFLSSLISWIDPENIIFFNQFIDYNERKLVEKNDLTTYKSFDEISCEISKVDIKMITKEMETQVISLYSDDDWLVIKPLTYESSKKYGSNTKWCTTSAQNPEYFFRYTKNGVLIYCINRKTGYKVAAYKDMKERDVSFWNQRDERIDSFYTELTDEIISILRKEFKTCSKPNGSLIDISIREKEMLKYLKENKKMSIGDEVVEAPLRRIRVDNRYDEGGQDHHMEEDGGDMEVEADAPMEDRDMTMEERMVYNGEQEMVERVAPNNRQFGIVSAEPQLTRGQILDLLSDQPMEDVATATAVRDISSGTGIWPYDVNYEDEIPQRG